MLPYLLIDLLYIGIPVVRTDGRLLGRAVHEKLKARTALRFSASSSQNWLNDKNCVSSSSTRIQTGKYEIGSMPIPVEDRTCLVCEQNQVEDEQHFLMFCNGCNVLRRKLINFISNEDVAFVNLTAHDGIKY